MVFTTQIFLFLFFPLCFAVYYLAVALEKIPRLGKGIKRIRLQDWIIVLFSCGFYAWAGLGNTIKIIIYILVIYVFARILEKTSAKKQYLALKTENDESAGGTKRIYLSAVLLAVILAVLIFFLVRFKYTPMIARVWNFVFGDNRSAHSLTAPLGLSFITFSAISYLVDIYRGDAAPGSFLDCTLYILFFPKVVSGPIVLWKEFKKQIHCRRLSLDTALSGMNRIMIGFAKKAILADSFGGCLASMRGRGVDRITAAAALLLYMLQIYYDFSGYSDIAIGLASLFGFEFNNNFNFPYRSKSITEFWRRWHISLGNWFKEYVYIPLGGNRRGLKCTLRNLLIVFLLTGIWHGAGGSYLLWGLINAGLVILERVIREKNLYQKTPGWIKYVCTMLIVMCFWQLFRFGSVTSAVNWFGIFFGWIKPEDITFTWKYYLDLRMIVFVIIGVLGATVLGSPRICRLYNRVSATKTGVLIQQIIMLFLFVLSIFFVVNSTYSPFIYFQY